MSTDGSSWPEPAAAGSWWSFLAGMAVAAALLGLLGPLARPASAHDVNQYVPSRWKPGSSQAFSFTNGFPGDAYRDRVVDGWSAWNARNQRVLFSQGPAVADFNPFVCPTIPVNAVHWVNLADSPGFDTYGLTVSCGAGGTLAASQVILDSDQAWYVGTGQPPGDRVDLWSTATHEFGHAAGLSHFDANDHSICGTNDVSETMCGVYGPGLTGARSLGFHDVHTFEAAYAPTVYIRDGVTGGPLAAPPFEFGGDGDQFLACDWDGNGTDTISTFRAGVFFVRNANSTGGGWPVPYGSPGDTALCGDWNGDGTDTFGVFRGGSFFLRNSNTTGVADSSFAYGMPGDRPLIGDWNGSVGGARDTVGIARGGFFYLRNANSTGVADVSFIYGAPGDDPLVGDWNGDGVTTPAVHRAGTWYLRNSNTSGPANQTSPFGTPADHPLAGNWTARPDHLDSPGIIRGS